MAKLKEEISVVEDEVNQATKSIDEMKATKERLSTAGDVDCDEAVTATAPVFKQLLQGTVWWVWGCIGKYLTSHFKQK